MSVLRRGYLFARTMEVYLGCGVGEFGNPIWKQSLLLCLVPIVLFDATSVAEITHFTFKNSVTLSVVPNLAKAKVRMFEC